MPETRVRESFSRQTIMTTLGARMEAVEPGKVVIALPFAPHLTQQHGFLHAGVIATIADSACGYAALSLMPAGKAVLTSEFKINLLSPAKAESFEAIGRVIRAGNKVHVAMGEVFGITGETRKAVAVMLASLMVIDAEGLAD